MTNNIASFLKYASLQMAAEAVNLDQVQAGEMTLNQALVLGNNRASRFTATQATAFSDQYEIVAYQANTSTGFSGTLFKDNETGELILSFRSTEFLEDAARDNQATNALEIKPYGWASGQIAAMQKWYSDLQSSGVIKADDRFTVTGYSLGGHLATAFNLLHDEDEITGGTKKIAASSRIPM